MKFLCPNCNSETIRKFKTCIGSRHCKHCFKDLAKTSKKNDKPILLEEALKICSPESSQLVHWNCPDCGATQIKTFKQAIKVKRCKPCNNKVRPKPNHSGKNNPMFGKSLPQKTGSESPNWKGGKKKCPDCGVTLKDYRGEFCRKCHQKGERNPGWNSNLTQEERIKQRNTPSHRIWAHLVKARDNFTCQICQKIGGQLHSHHLNSYSKFPQERYKIENGVTLCKSCHWIFHKKYGKHRNTKEQFFEFRAYVKSNSKMV